MNGKLHRLWATKNKKDEWWSSFVTSPLAIAANYVVVDWKWLNPNLLTLFSFITALIATGLIVMGGAVNFYIAAGLIQVSHILDCMDGQMARYRGVSSRSGGFFDKITDQIQVSFWFGAIGYAGFVQFENILPVYLAFSGVAFYTLRGYVKYVTIFIEMSDDKEYLEKSSREISSLEEKTRETAGLGHGFSANLRWFIGEQKKVFFFDEGVFIFMLSISLVFNQLIPILWIFAVSQTLIGLARSIQRGRQLYLNQPHQILAPTEK